MPRQALQQEILPPVKFFLNSIQSNESMKLKNIMSSFTADVAEDSMCLIDASKISHIGHGHEIEQY